MAGEEPNVIAGHTLSEAMSNLASAVESMPDGSPCRCEKVRAVWPRLGRHSILGWIEALGRDLRKIEQSIERAAANPLADDGVSALEEALWRADAAREKLNAVFALCFGTSVLSPGGHGYEFRPDTDQVRRRLSQLAKSNDAARQLQELSRRLWSDDTVTLRNLLSHKLAHLSSVETLCNQEYVFLDFDGRTERIEFTPMVGKGSLEGKTSIQADDLFAAALASCQGGLDGLIRAAGLMGDLARAEAKLELPALVVVARNADDGKEILVGHSP